MTPISTRPVRPAGRSAAAERGFTLIELMVSLTIFTLVIGGVLGVLFHVDRSWTMSQDMISTRQNERAGLELMINDIRMAGSGFGGVTVTTPGAPGNRIFPLEPRPGRSAPDTLILTGGFTGIWSSTNLRMAGPGDVLQVPNASLFAVGDRVVVTNGSDANLFELTGVNTATGVLEHSESSSFNTVVGHDRWPNGGYDSGARVVKVSQMSYWVDEDGDTGQKILMRRDSAGAEDLEVASAINWLRLRFVTASDSVAVDPPDPSQIRSVLLDYVSPNAEQLALYDGVGDDGDTLSLRIQPRVLF